MFVIQTKENFIKLLRQLRFLFRRNDKTNIFAKNHKL